MSTDDELEKIKQQMMKRMMAPAPAKPSLLRDGQVNELTDTNFRQAMSEADKPVLVDFWAEWCAPCKMMAPVIHQLAAEYAGRAYIAKLNVDHNPSTAAQYRVMSIPNFIVFKGGQPVGQTVGAVGKPGLVQLIQRGLG
jgi:thioredoxin 1